VAEDDESLSSIFLFSWTIEKYVMVLMLYIASSDVLCNSHIYREYIYYVDRVHGTAFHGDLCAACRETRANFVGESACLTAHNVRNEVVTIHRSQEVLKMLSPLHVFFAVNCFVIKIILLALTAHQTPTFTGWLQ
jgi:hypothetical protein